MGPGGKKPCMRNTVFVAGNGPTVQYMVFQPGDTEFDTGLPIGDKLLGQPKGLKRVLQERGLWRANLKKQCDRVRRPAPNANLPVEQSQESEEEMLARTLDQCAEGKDCCALRIMAQQPDFLNEESLLERVVKEAGHEVIFYPKFHCELNFIEAFWAAVKRYTRENCSYTFAELEPTVIKGLDSVPLKTIRRFAGKSMRWILSYAERDLTPEQLAYTKMVYSSHRREYRKDKGQFQSKDSY